MAIASKIVVTHLKWDESGLVSVLPEDKDRFVITMHRAVEILRLADRAEQFERQFKLLLSLLAAWLRSRTDIKNAFVTHHDERLAFVVVRSLCECNDAFEDELSDLDFGIANDPDLDLVKMVAISLPPASDKAIGSFLDPRFIFEYAGHGN